MQRRHLIWSLVGMLCIGTAALSMPAQQSEPPASPVIRVTTRLVMVDVIAVDKSGKPVTDLKQEEFVVEESGKKQKISVFGLQSPPAAATAPVLPAGIFSNRPEAQLARGRRPYN